MIRCHGGVMNLLHMHLTFKSARSAGVHWAENGATGSYTTKVQLQDRCHTQSLSAKSSLSDLLSRSGTATALEAGGASFASIGFKVQSTRQSMLSSTTKGPNSPTIKPYGSPWKPSSFPEQTQLAAPGWVTSTEAVGTSQRPSTC